MLHWIVWVWVDVCVGVSSSITAIQCVQSWARWCTHSRWQTPQTRRPPPLPPLLAPPALLLLPLLPFLPPPPLQLLPQHHPPPSWLPSCLSSRLQSQLHSGWGRGGKQGVTAYATFLPACLPT